MNKINNPSYWGLILLVVSLSIILIISMYFNYKSNRYYKSTLSQQNNKIKKVVENNEKLSKKINEIRKEVRNEIKSQEIVLKDISNVYLRGKR